MKKSLQSVVLIFFACVMATALAVICKPAVGHAQNDDWYQWYPAENQSHKDRAELVAKFGNRGKLRGTEHPTEAVFGQIFVDTKHGREWIFDGAQWVPHDNTVEAYYEFLKTFKKTPPNMECRPAGGKKGGAQ